MSKVRCQMLREALMNFLPQNPKTRKTVLIVIAAGLALFSFVFLYLTYFAPAPSADVSLSVSGEKARALSEQAVKKIDRDISSIENELKNDFYKSLRKRVWTPDKTAPGNKNPFSE